MRDCADPFVDDLIIASGNTSMSYEELLEAHERDVETRLGGQEQRSQWHGQQHCLAPKT